eukprot:scaffold129755_cov11-Prasinocladus_malaysianus.AAC.1
MKNCYLTALRGRCAATMSTKTLIEWQFWTVLPWMTNSEESRADNIILTGQNKPRCRKPLQPANEKWI